MGETNTEEPSKAEGGKELVTESPESPEVLEETGIPDDIVNKIPKEARKEVFSFLASMKTWGPPPHPFADKITSEHLSRLIDHVADEGKRDASERSSWRRYCFFYFLIALAAFLGLVAFLIQTGKESLLTGIGIAIVSFAGGYGLGRRGK